MSDITRADAIAEERAAKRADALDRAWRTLKQGILVDAAAMAGGGILELTGHMDVTTEQFWAAAGGLVLKSLVVSAASYIHRLKAAPKQ